MKVAIWLENISETSGGGFSLTEKFIHLIDEHNFHKDIQIVFISEKKNRSKLFTKDLIEVIYPRFIYLAYFILSKICNILIFSSIKSEFLRNIRRKTLDIYLMRFLETQKIDLIYYPLQSFCRLPDFPFIASNWDIGHRSCFSFPEFHIKDMSETRNLWYDQIMLKALAVIAESETGKAELVKYTNISPEKIKVVHLFPGKSTKVKPDYTIFEKNNLKKNAYFFYPSQFWPHKNHYNLILAFKSILEKNPEMRLVFTGSDMGNESYLKGLVKSLSIQDNVEFLGHVSIESITALYIHATALVMPTFLSPTNMPLLEARDLNCPVLCSDLSGHREELGEGALYFDPLSYENIAKCMEKTLDQGFRGNLLSKANNERKKSLFNETIAIKELEDILIETSKYRKCWGKNSELIIYRKK